MKLEGKNIIKANRDAVWQSLNDPKVLAKAIPGCQEMNLTAESLYAGVVKLGIGPVKGSYTFTVTVTESIPPVSCELHFEGKGLRGFTKMTSPIRLNALSENVTEVSWQGSGEVGGPLAAAGDRILIGISRMLIKQFFNTLENEIREGDSHEAGSF
jgi:uncharacterized protein